MSDETFTIYIFLENNNKRSTQYKELSKIKTKQYTRTKGFILVLKLINVLNKTKSTLGLWYTSAYKPLNCN